MEIKDIAWVAGILEGEGCFRSNGPDECPRIILGMTDEDVMRKIHGLFGGSFRGPIETRTPKGMPAKAQYNITWNGKFAAGLMMTIFSFMGKRRRSKIKEVLDAWKSHRVCLPIESQKRDSIKLDWKTGKFTQAALATKHKINPGTVSRIVREPTAVPLRKEAQLSPSLSEPASPLVLGLPLPQYIWC